MPAPIHVAGKAGHQIAGAVAVEKGHLLVLKVLEQFCLDVADHVLGAALIADDHHIAQSLQYCLYGQHGQQQAQQRLRMTAHDDRIHQLGG